MHVGSITTHSGITTMISFIYNYIYIYVRRGRGGERRVGRRKGGEEGREVYGDFFVRV